MIHGEMEFIKMASLTYRDLWKLTINMDDTALDSEINIVDIKNNKEYNLETPNDFELQKSPLSLFLKQDGYSKKSYWRG